MKQVKLKQQKDELNAQLKDSEFSESCTYGWCTGLCHMRICGIVYLCVT